MKKILVFLSTLLGLFLIYRHFENKSINYVSIGDSLINNEYQSVSYNNYIKEYLNSYKSKSLINNYFYNNTINGLTNDIQNNRTIWLEEEYYFKKVLRESDVLVISVGMEELKNNYNKYDMNNNYVIFNKMYLDIMSLIREVKKYAHGVIIFVGYYNPTNYYDSKTDELFYDIDIKLNRLMMNNGITYLDLYQKVKGNKYKESNSYLLNASGYNILAQTIEFYLK